VPVLAQEQTPGWRSTRGLAHVGREGAGEQVSIERSQARPGHRRAADVAGVFGVGAAGSGIVSDRTGLAASAVEIGRGIGTGAGATCRVNYGLRIF